MSSQQLPLPDQQNEDSNQPGRRAFLKESCAIAIGAVTGLVPAVSGLGLLLDPVRHPAKASDASFVTPLSALPENGDPLKCPILATREDAWNRSPNTPIGAVYLRRLADKEVRALNVVCPHAGCFLDYQVSEKCFHCPCHNSNFTLDGALTDSHSPSPRGMDELPVEIRDGKEVWVKFQNFRAGEKEKIPV
jgi:menaquinol-cytochrome c reductase iron-sulfur subunit